MVHKRETKAINKLCVLEILSLSFVCGTYFFEFRGRNLVCFVIAYNFNGRYAPEAGKTRMRTAFLTRALGKRFIFRFVGDYSQTPAAPISQLQAISQVFSSYPPSGEFCQVS